MNPRRKAGLFILYGRPGAGKSFEWARAFQNSIAILSAPTNLNFYEQWLANDGKDSGKTLPKRTITIDTHSITDSAAPDLIYVEKDIHGRNMRLSQKFWLDFYISKIVDKTLTEANAKLPLTYTTMAIDEGGTFWTRIFEEIAPTVKNEDGKLDPRGAFNVGAKWSREFIDRIRQVIACGMNVVYIAHDKDPDPTKKKVGGPDSFSQGAMKQLCAPADGVILRELLKPQIKFPDMSLAADPVAFALAMEQAENTPPDRVWRVHASPDNLAKIRGIPDSKFYEIRRMLLEDIIRMAGFTP